MRAILRNLQSSSPLSIDFTGFDVDPINVIIDPGKSEVVNTSLSIKEFRAISNVNAEITANNLSVSFSGGMQNVN